MSSLKTVWIWAAALLGVFAPIKPAIIVAVILVFADLVSGVWAAKKQQIPITSSGLKSTIGKLFLYEAAILLGYLAQTYLTGTILPVSSLITSVVGLTELKSILENADVIYGSSVFSALLTRITQSKDTLSP